MQGVEVHKTTADTEVTQKSGKVKIPAGSYVVRMDQPYSRMADMLLDTQYYNVNDPRSLRRYRLDAGRAAQREDHSRDGHGDSEGSDDDG